MKLILRYSPILFFGLAIFGLVHHFVVTGGVWWQMEQFMNSLHHENLIVLCIVAGVSLIVGKYLVKKGEL